MTASHLASDTEYGSRIFATLVRDDARCLVKANFDYHLGHHCGPGALGCAPGSHPGGRCSIHLARARAPFVYQSGQRDFTAQRPGRHRQGVPMCRGRQPSVSGGFVQRPGRRVLSAATKVRVLHPLPICRAAAATFKFFQRRYRSMAERLCVEQETIGSIPTGGAIFFGSVV